MGNIEVEREGRIATVYIDHQEHRNAMTRQMYSELPRQLTQLDQDPSVAVIVLRGRGREAFASGRDVRELADFDHKMSLEDQLLVTRAEHVLQGLTKPTIAMIHGACFGGGVGLALCCDIRLADENSRFAVPPANLGLVYSFDATRRLINAVGVSRANWLLMTGLSVGSEKALTIGLVDEIVPADELEEQTSKLALRISTRAQLSVRGSKEIIRRIQSGQGKDNNVTMSIRNAAFYSQDYEEGVRAFLERRDPEFL